MALNRKKLLKAVGVACTVFGITAAIMGVVFGVVNTVEYFGLDERVSIVAIFVPLFVFMVVDTYRDQ
jgi:nicotinamide riboside transporter PnuC